MYYEDELEIDKMLQEFGIDDNKQSLEPIDCDGISYYTKDATVDDLMAIVDLSTVQKTDYI